MRYDQIGKIAFMLLTGHIALFARLSACFLWIAFSNSGVSQQSTGNLQTAQNLFAGRNLEEARREFLLLEKSGEAPMLARYYLGRIALLESNPLEAIKWLEPVARLPVPVLDSLEQLGKAYFDLGRFDEAKVLTKRALQGANWNGALHYRLGRIYQQLGEQEASRQEFAESIRLKTADRQSVEKLLQCSEYLSKGESSQAIRIGREALVDSSLDPDVLVALGLTFVDASLPEESVALFQRAAERDPGFIQAQFNAGLALLKLHRPREALVFLQKARELAPGAAEINAALALGFFSDDRFSEAVVPLEEWLKLDPKNPRALNMLGLSQLRTGSAARAIPLFRKSIEVSRDDPKPYFLLVEALNASEQQEEALRVAEKGVQKFPSVARMHLAKAQQLARLGHYGEAGPVFGRAAALAPGQTEPLLGLAESQQKQGAYLASLDTYQRALAIDKGNVPASLGAARNLLSLKRLSEARGLLESALVTNPGESRLHYELLGVYARLGERELAAEQTQILDKIKSRPASAQ